MQEKFVSFKTEKRNDFLSILNAKITELAISYLEIKGFHNNITRVRN